MITSGNDSSIYTRSIAGVQGLFKRVIAKSTCKQAVFVKGKPYVIPSLKPTTQLRAKSARIQLLAARKREKLGGGTEFIKLRPGIKPTVKMAYRKRFNY